jgi:branched-chain amino acid transport system ATP-binding protein
MEREQPLLEVSQLQAGYGPLQVIWDVSLRVEQGEFVALIGPNGAGKTTTLRAIMGLVRPLSGTITFEGQTLNGLKANQITRKGISFVTEDLDLFDGMTVHDNLILGGFSLHDRTQVEQTLESVYELFPILAERHRQLAGTLSGGERKMLAIGRGLMLSPSLILVDEPSLGLAPKLVLAVFEALKQLHERGSTILLVEQNVYTTLHMTNRAYVLENGQVVMEGPSSDLLQNEHLQKTYISMGAAEEGGFSAPADGGGPAI